MARRQQLTTDKATNEVIAEAIREHGATVAFTNGGHIKVTLPNRRTVIVAFSPSDRRTAMNTRAHIRRALQEPAR